MWFNVAHNSLKRRGVTHADPPKPLADLPKLRCFNKRLQDYLAVAITQRVCFLEINNV